MAVLANNTFDSELSILTYFKLLRLIQVMAKIFFVESDYKKVLNMEIPLNSNLQVSK
jgi:hypothetical protein